MDLLNKLKSMLGEQAEPENVVKETAKCATCQKENCACKNSSADCNCADGSCENCKKENGTN